MEVMENLQMVHGCIETWECEYYREVIGGNNGLEYPYGK